MCEWKGVNRIEAEVCIDQIFERWANARYKYRHREFWCRGYYLDIVGKNTKKIKEYIANQLKEDQEGERLTLDFEDPFKGK